MMSAKQDGTTSISRSLADCRFSNWPPQSRYCPVERRTSLAIAACASATTPATSRPRTFACTTTRSEEHTSELQSLMRISYAVFCLKKKTQKSTHNKKQIHKNSQYS